QRIVNPKRVRPTDQYQEGRLKRVFDGVLVPEYRAAGAENHLAVALDQRSKCFLGAISGAVPKLFEELPVRQTADRTDVEERPDMPEHIPLPSSNHARLPSRFLPHRYLVMTNRSRVIPKIPFFSLIFDNMRQTQRRSQ